MEWGDWSNCSVTCAGGVMYRNRLCEGPFYNGEACVGADVDNATCNEFACPGKNLLCHSISGIACTFNICY